MKLALFAAVLAGAGVTQVLAVPFVIPSNAPSFTIRIGHVVPNPNDFPSVVGESVPMKRIKRPCGGRVHRLNQKAVEVSNFFRQALGLPLIKSDGHPGHGDSKIRILPFIGTPPTFAPVHDNKIEELNINDVPNMPHPRPHHAHHGHHGHHRHHDSHHRLGKGSFVTRIHYSLMNLGRWEGRAVAFVLGCGIGVLLRMMWVLAVVMYRAVKGQRDDEHEYSQITIIEEVVDSPKSSPPVYTYPVDEKVDIDVAKAPTTTEESK